MRCGRRAMELREEVDGEADPREEEAEQALFMLAEAGARDRLGASVATVLMLTTKVATAGVPQE